MDWFMWIHKFHASIGRQIKFNDVFHGSADVGKNAVPSDDIFCKQVSLSRCLWGSFVFQQTRNPTQEWLIVSTHNLCSFVVWIKDYVKLLIIFQFLSKYEQLSDSWSCIYKLCHRWWVGRFCGETFSKHTQSIR